MRRRWFLPKTPDVIGSLTEQAQVTVAGMESFAAWSSGDEQRATAVREREHAADQARRRVLHQVREAYVTPISPEDLFELSERLDEVLNAAKNIVREAELLAVAPDAFMAQMADEVRQGVGDLAQAFPNLAAEPDRATDAADRAIKRQRAIEHVYRRAMSALLEQEDLRAVTARRELYRRYARMGDAMEAVAHRIWYAVVKQA